MERNLKKIDFYSVDSQIIPLIKILFGSLSSIPCFQDKVYLKAANAALEPFNIDSKVKLISFAVH